MKPIQVVAEDNSVESSTVEIPIKENIYLALSFLFSCNKSMVSWSITGLAGAVRVYINSKGEVGV